MFQLTRNMFRVSKNMFRLNRNMFQLTRNMFWLTRNMFRMTRNMYWLTRNMLRWTRNMFRLTRNIYLLTPPGKPPLSGKRLVEIERLVDPATRRNSYASSDSYGWSVALERLKRNCVEKPKFSTMLSGLCSAGPIASNKAIKTIWRIIRVLSK